MTRQRPDRRRFLALGLAATGGRMLATGPRAGCASEESNADKSGVQPKPLPRGIDLEKWKRIKGKPYARGAFGEMPGVCRLPGPLAKRNWPDRSKYKGAKKVPGMCQLCSSVCGIMGYVKAGRVIKIEGNPNDPNSRGHLCARGQAGLNHLYHPERLLYPMKRVGARGEGKWKRIGWEEALDEIEGGPRKWQARGVCLPPGPAA